ncbi:MAG TPA: hypothetical protein VGL11_22470 [Candidatus Binatia bacterium]|jgi:hypothetical protein
MIMPVIAVVAMLVLGALFVLIPVACDTYRRFSRRLILNCPETNLMARICIDARHAACSSLFGPARLKVSDCTRWPMRKDCAQDCLSRL